MNKKDSLSDKNTVFKKQMKREDFLIFVKKRKECNARAQKIVERLLDTTTEDVFLQVLKYLNQAYLDDVFEERFILKVCGYPLCNNQLGSIPKHQYKISTAVNKVYDITERKKFCSPQCFSASKYIKEQLPSSPLWVLENEEKRCYRLWNHTKNIFSSSIGDEIELKYDHLKPSEKVVDRSQNIKQETSDDANILPILTTNNLLEANSSNVSVNSIKGINENNASLPDKALLSTYEKGHHEESGGESAVKCVPETISKKIKNETTEIKLDGQRNKSKVIDARIIPKLSVLDVVTNTLRSWITKDTLIYLFEEERVKMFCKEYEIQFKSNADSKLTLKQEEKYANLCRKLDLMEIQEKSSSENKCENLKPLPDYESLRLENNKLMIKVQAFYEGKTDIPANELNVNDFKSTSLTKEDIDEKLFLPLTDQYDQKVKRIGIVLSYLDPILKNFLLEFNIIESISFELRQLVHTFDLDATNITFKPALQKLLALFVLGLISMLPQQKDKLQTIYSSKLFEQILNAYYIQIGQFFATINDVTDMEKVIGTKKQK